MLWAAQSIFSAAVAKVKPQLLVLVLWLLVQVEIDLIFGVIVRSLQNDGVLVGLNELIRSQLRVILDATVCAELQHFFDYLFENTKVLLIIKKSRDSDMKQGVT